MVFEKWYFVVLSGGLFCLAIGFFLFSSLRAPEVRFHPNLSATIMDKETLAAARRLEGIDDCNATGDLSDFTIDWTRIDNTEDAKVCLFLLFENFDGPAEVLEWFNQEDFSTSGPSLGPGDSSTMREFGYDPSDKITRITASWDLASNPPKFGDSNAAHAFGVGVRWFPDGELMSVNAWYVMH